MSLASLLKKGSLRGFVTATPATFATYTPYRPPSVATVATLAVAKAQNTAANVPTPDPDLWCWPQSIVMNGAEIDTLTARLERFIDKGFSLDDSEALVDRLVVRDRDGDDRHLCVECAHCRFGMRCDKKLAVLDVLQRCDHFTSSTNP